MKRKIKIPRDMVAGTKYKTKSHGVIEVVLYENSKVVHVKFLLTGCKTCAQADSIRKGGVSDNLTPSIIGIGFIGCGKYKSTSNGKTTIAYNAWTHMLERCYSDKCQEKHPTYKGCSVDKIWHNFQNFAEWHNRNYPICDVKHHLDKDLLIFNNKIYSPKTCVFVPIWLNSFTTDSGATRGNWLIGASFDIKRGLFQARCGVNGKDKRIGYFKTQHEAHNAWLEFKLNLAIERKPEMDSIDLRIYPNVVKIIKSAK